MNFADAQAAIYARLNTYWSAAHAGVPVDYENRFLVDLAAQQDPFIACDVLFNDGEQASIEADPMSRYRGAVYLAVWVREGSGTAAAFGFLSELGTLFATKAFGGLNTQAPRPLPGRRQAGWLVEVLRVPFWFDTKS